jgi:hypothetical protein
MAPRARSTFTRTSFLKNISGSSRRKENSMVFAFALVRMDRSSLWARERQAPSPHTTTI